jgi:hypothetical protein
MIQSKKVIKEPIMTENYITMNKEILAQRWVTGGPLLELSVLSVIPTPREWFPKMINDEYIKYTPSSDEKINNKIHFLEENMVKIKSLSQTIEILENDERITKEIFYLCKNEIRLIDIKIMVNIGYKRKGRLWIELVDDSIFLYKVMYIDEDGYYCRKEARKLFSKLMKLLNGLCGTIGLESGPNDILKIKDLLMNRGGKGYVYGIEHVKWNSGIKRKR